MITTTMYDFFIRAYIPIFLSLFFYLTFLIIGSHIVFISILNLPNICADSLRCLILQCSSLSLYLHPIRADGFPFPSMYSPPYLTFQFYLLLLLFNVLLALFLLAACLAILYFITTTRDGVHTVLGHVKFCWWFDMEEIPPELEHLWILSWCHMDYIFFGSFWLGFWQIGIWAQVKKKNHT